MAFDCLYHRGQDLRARPLTTRRNVQALGFFAFHVGGSLIHIALLVAIVSLALHFVRGWP
jgi:hypothetical protein